MEFELNVPTEPVSVSKNTADPVTDVVVQNLANFPLQLRTKLNLSNKHHGKYLPFSFVPSDLKFYFLAKSKTEIHYTVQYRWDPKINPSESRII